MRRNEYEEREDEVIELLSNEALTARQLTKELELSKPAVYRHIDRLTNKWAGCVLVGARREGKSGPMATTYFFVAPKPAEKKYAKKNRRKK
jgi:predicted ArsR family transcriptional regulator